MRQDINFKKLSRNWVTFILAALFYFFVFYLSVFDFSVAYAVSSIPTTVVTKTTNLPDFTSLIEKNTQAVVNISTSRNFSSYKKLIKLPPELEGTPQGELFKKFFEDQDEARNHEESLSLGSGAIISKDGYIVTNQHVVVNADKILVKLADKREFAAKLVGYDKGSDVALLKINANELPVVTLGDSDQLKVGEWVIAIGSPFGFEHSATAGIVSGKRRSIGNDRYVPFIQTDAAINPGNSGGPLFDLNGNVVGINSQILSKTGGYLGLSFAIPSNIVRNVVQQLKGNGYVIRGWLGVSFQELSTELAKSFGLDRASGALVASIVKDSPAAKAGLKNGDVILKLNDEPILDAGQLPAIVGNTPPGTQIELTVFRGGNQQIIKLTVGQLEQDEIKKVEGYNSNGDNDNKNSKELTKDFDRLGIKTRSLNDEDRKVFGVETGGVIISKILPGSVAENINLSEGLVIIALNMHDITDNKNYDQLVKSLPVDKWITILVKNDSGNKRYFAFKITK